MEYDPESTWHSGVWGGVQRDSEMCIRRNAPSEKQLSTYVTCENGQETISPPIQQRRGLRFLISSEALIWNHYLRGPAAMLFISGDTFSDSIAKIVRACFPGVSHKYRAICCKMGYRTDMSV